MNWSNVDLYFGGIPPTEGIYNTTIYNYGLWNAKTDNSLHGSSLTDDRFYNYGTFRKSSGGGTTTLDNNFELENSGTVDVQSGTLEIQEGYEYGISNGTFNIATNTRVYFTDADYGFLSYGGTSFTGSGSILGNLTGSSGGRNIISGNITYLGGTIEGLLTVASNAVLNLAAGTSFFVPNLNNYGTIAWTSGDLYGVDGQINNYGLWDAKTNNSFYGQFGDPTIFNNYGVFRKSGGTTNSGETLLDTNITFNNSGTIDVEVGRLALDGGCSLAGGTLSFSITNSSNFSSLYFASNVTLTGALQVNLNPRYSPAAGSSFTLISYASETGMFTSMNVPHLSGLIWKPNYDVTLFTLTVTNLSPPTLLPITTSNNKLSFSWDTFNGQTYQVQYTTNLAPANWINLGTAISGTNGAMSVSDVIGLNPQQFYRVVVLP